VRIRFENIWYYLVCHSPSVNYEHAYKVHILKSVNIVKVQTFTFYCWCQSFETCKIDRFLMSSVFFMEFNWTQSGEVSSMCLHVTPPKIVNKFLWNFISSLYTKYVLGLVNIQSTASYISHENERKLSPPVFQKIPHLQNFYTFHNIQLIFTSWPMQTIIMSFVNQCVLWPACGSSWRFLQWDQCYGEITPFACM